MEIPVNVIKVMLKHCKDKDFPNYAPYLFYDSVNGALASFNPHSIILLKRPECMIDDLDLKPLDTDSLNFFLMMKTEKTVDLDQVKFIQGSAPYLSKYFKPAENFKLESFNPEYLMMGFKVCKAWCKHFPSPQCISMGNGLGLWHKKLTDDLEFFHALAGIIM